MLCTGAFMGCMGAKTDPTLLQFWFNLSDCVNYRNNRHWSAQNPTLIHDVPLHDMKVGVWCAMSATTMVKPFS